MSTLISSTAHSFIVVYKYIYFFQIPHPLKSFFIIFCLSYLNSTLSIVNSSYSRSLLNSLCILTTFQKSPFRVWFKMVYILYHYDPSFVAAVIFICLFTTSTLLHLFQMVRMRTWYFIPFLIGGVCMWTLPPPIALERSYTNIYFNS
jgi:hypothetical protein